MKSRTEFGHPIFFIDPDFSIRKCSRRLKNLLELSDDSIVLGRPCYQLFYNLDQPCRMCPVPRAVVLKTTVEQKIPDDAHGGQSRLLSATPIVDADGVVQHLILDCLGEHISIHKNIKSTSELITPEHVPATQTVLLDRDLTVILYSKGSNTFISEKSMDIIGRNIFTVAPYYNRSEIRNRLENFIYRDEKRLLQFDTDDADYGAGKTNHVIEKLDGHGHLEAVLLRSTAVQYKSAENRQHLLTQLNTLSQFAGRMAHDIKNALALISTNADFIFSESENFPDKQNNIAHYAEIIQKHVKQIVGIVELANSLKVHNWDTTAESDLAQLLNRVVTITQLSKPYISHDVRLKIEGEMPRIITSELYLERALTELVKSILLNSKDNASLSIHLVYRTDDDNFVMMLNCRQQTDLFSNIEQKLQQFYSAKKQWDPAMLGVLVAYAAILIQGGSMQHTLLENGEFHIQVKLPRAPYKH